MQLSVGVATSQVHQWPQLTMLPPAFIARSSARRQKKTPRVFTAKLKSHVSSDISVIGWAGLMMPAMFTAPSSLPSFSTVVRIHASTELLCRTSMTVYICFPLSVPVNDSVAVLRAASLMSARDMIAPREASNLAVARPIPEAAPVIAI